MIVAGDAAGLLEPFTREGISFALRSGALAGAAAARRDLDGYVSAVTGTLVGEMRAGFALLAAHERRPGLFHAALATPPGWIAFARFCRGEMSFATAMRHAPLRAAIAGPADRRSARRPSMPRGYRGARRPGRIRRTPSA